MPRTFAYVRVSTTIQTTDNQIQEIQAAGFKVEPRRVVTETVSGSVATAQRRGFARLLDRLEPGDVLVVTKLDRLGRNAMDVGSTVARLARIGLGGPLPALGGGDLKNSTGQPTKGGLHGGPARRDRLAGPLPGAGRRRPDELDRQADDGRHQRGRRVRAGPPGRAHPGGAEPGQGGGQAAGPAGEPDGGAAPERAAAA